MTQEMQNGERLVPFMGVKILLAGSVLAPRAETELLGNAALALLGGMEGAGLLAIDMCCGSGNLCCGLASAAPQVTFLGADLTDDAVAAARLNVERLGRATGWSRRPQRAITGFPSCVRSDAGGALLCVLPFDDHGHGLAAAQAERHQTAFFVLAEFFEQFDLTFAEFGRGFDF